MCQTYIKVVIGTAATSADSENAKYIYIYIYDLSRLCIQF